MLFDSKPLPCVLLMRSLAAPYGAATLTVLETVANGATLLATQTFERRGGEQGGAEETAGSGAEGAEGAEEDQSRWVMTGHTTIPYGKDVVAKIVLRCDAGGCVAVQAKAVASSMS